MRVRFMVLTAAVLALAAMLTAALSQASPPPPVRSATLTQAGQMLVWRAVFSAPFPAAELRHGGQPPCLLLEPVSGQGVLGQVCLEAPARSGGPWRLDYAPVSARGAGVARQIAASVTWSSGARELSASFALARVDPGYGALRWQVRSTIRAASCSSTASPAAVCEALYPASAPLAPLHTPRLVGCVPSGPSLVLGNPNGKREVALTFDDGPSENPPTSAFLDVLEREHAVGTFFEIGDQIAHYDPGGVAERRMLADGDMIGDHSWTHPDVAALSPAGQRSQLLLTVAAIRQATGGFTPCLWRAPYGDISPALIARARSLGLLTVMWDVDTSDYELPGVNVIYRRVIDGAYDGAIILQHFGGGPRYQTLAALPREIATLRREGYRFVTVAQLLGLRLIYR